MKRILIVIWVVLGVVIGANAQSEQANRYFQQGDYATALNYYKQCVARDRGNAYYVYRYARCLQEVGRTEEAVEMFENPITTRYNTRAFFLGKAYMDVHRYADAAAMLSAFAAENPESAFYEQSLVLGEQAERLERFYQSTEHIRLLKGEEVERTDLLAQYPLGGEAGTLLIDHIGDGLHCATTYTNPRGDRRICADTTGIIWMQNKLLDDWSENDTLPMQGWWPILMADGVTLYFSAETENGAGGLDIYYTRFNPATNSYLQPTNAGSPYSSWGNDYFYFADENSQRGYFATDRLTDGEHVGVYTFRMQESKRYLRGEENEELRRELILLSRMNADEDENVNVNVNEDVNENENDAQSADANEEFRLVINDSVVYTSYADFQSDSARVLYQAYQQMQSDWEQEKEELARMRANYIYCSAEERESLATVILSLEKDVARLKNELRALLQQVLRKEKP